MSVNYTLAMESPIGDRLATLVTPFPPMIGDIVEAAGRRFFVNERVFKGAEVVLIVDELECSPKNSENG